MSAAPSQPAPPRRRLPFTLYALAGLMLLKTLLLALVVAGANLDSVRPLLGLSTSRALLDAIRDTPGAGAVLMVFAALLVVSVIGIVGRRRFGWLLAMVVTGLFVALDIYGFAYNAANHLWMGLNILTVFYLNQQDVREAVGAADALAAGAAGDEP